MSAIIFDHIPAAARRVPRAPASRPPTVIDDPIVTPFNPRTGNRTLALVAGIAVLHVAGVVVLAQSKVATSAPPQAVPINIVMVPPKVTPPPSIPEPVVAQIKTIAPPKIVVPQLEVPVVATVAPVLSTTTQAPPAPVHAVVAAVAAEPVPAPVEEPVTEPKGYAGYLKNPAPDYPAAAQKRGLEGKVILKVHVLASGQPDNVSVAKSSGHQILDDAAIRAVTQWAFAPAKRGQIPIDGWVQVPLTFRI